MLGQSRTTAVLIGVFLRCATVWADGELPGWQPSAAAKYLDERATTWFASDSRGEGANRSTCISCHTVLPYLLGRPVLRKIAGAAPTEQETKLLAQTRMRVEHWNELDSDKFGLFYDDSDQKKKESWGTESVFNALILALDDSNQGRSSCSDDTARAFSNLWASQAKAGEHQGSWDWLDFKEPPWGSADARYFGAALAAIAVGTAPGYYKPSGDAEPDSGIELLRGYLASRSANESLHNQAWALWAATHIDGILTSLQREQLLDALYRKQRADGGWSLASLGPWKRNDGTPQATDSDAYATGLVLHVLQIAGAPVQRGPIVKGLEWLRNNQTAGGAWRGISVVKQRDPESHVGRFMSDAATAFAILALNH